MGLPELPFQHRILLIEDDNVSLFAASEILSGLTAMVDMARDVEEATEQLNTVAYDLVISDISLPDGTGMDIIRWARNDADSKNKATPFVALTAHRDTQKHKQILDSGFFEVVTKPLSSARAYSFLNYCSLNKESGGIPAGSPLADKIVENNDTIADLAIIDLRLGLQRMGAKHDEKAVIAIGMLIDSLKEDISQLKQLYAKNDIAGVRGILHKIEGGLDYSGVPRLQQHVVRLHAAVKNSADMVSIEPLFNDIYEQVDLLTEAYQEMLVRRRG